MFRNIKYIRMIFGKRCVKLLSIGRIFHLDGKGAFIKHMVSLI